MDAHEPPGPKMVQVRWNEMLDMKSRSGFHHVYVEVLLKNKLRCYPQQQERICSNVMRIGLLSLKSGHVCVIFFIGWLAIRNLPIPGTLRNPHKPVPEPSGTLRPSGTFWNLPRNLRQHTPEPSLEPSGTLRRLRPAPAHTGAYKQTCRWHLQ